MTRKALKTRRFFVECSLNAGTHHELDRARSNYLLNVLRLRAGDGILVFNGYDGEWNATVEPTGRKSAALAVTELVRPQTQASDLLFLFAPPKQARLDYLIQKTVEMGAGTLQPVRTQFTQDSSLKSEKLRSYMIEAAEQCGVLALPELREIVSLSDAVQTLDSKHHLIFCDENARLGDPVADLRPLVDKPIAVLVGPEGGFSEEERAQLAARAHTVRLSLGPRILRADTAAVAALALVQAVAGDWRG